MTERSINDPASNSSYNTCLLHHVKAHPEVLVDSSQSADTFDLYSSGCEVQSASVDPL